MPDNPLTRRYDDGATEVATTPMSEAPTAPPAGRPSGPSGPSNATGAGRYVPGAEIARGGMGRVLVGTDTRLGREVAIKEALPDGADLERFEREVRITARLEHPSIVPLYDAGVTAAGRPFYVMRKVSGQPLERLIAERSGRDAERQPGRRPLDERLALLPHVLAAAHAVGHAHRRGVIHRDVKPANILIGELGETVVIDWGLAKVIGEDDAQAPRIDRAIAPSGDVATQAGAVFGTPGFMAPEQARGEALDPRSDVYALGATLYTVLAGASPPHGSLDEEVERAQRDRRAEPVTGEPAVPAALAALPLPPELIAIVGQAMQLDPARRYPDGAALADDLSRFLAGRLVEAHHYTTAQRLRRFVRRHRALVAVIASSVIVVAVGGVLAIRGVVLERERARQAEQDARADQRAAERARERETDRADDAVILKAHAELERDPTAAIATLATLAPQSRRWPQARPIAIEARQRGVAHVYPADAAPRVFEFAPDPRSLLIAGSLTGRVSIIDLEHDRERELVPALGPRTAAWGERGAVVWIAPATGGLYAIDVATGAQRPPVLRDTIEQLRADPAATYLGFAIRKGGAGWLDAAGVHFLPRLTATVEEVRVAPDGTWAAFATAHEVVVVDRDGRELARETGELLPTTLMIGASGKQLAVLAGRQGVLEIDVAGGKASARRVTVPWRVIWLNYINDVPYVNLHNANEMRPLHDLDSRFAEYGRLRASQETWGGYTAVATDQALLLVGPTPRTLWPPVHEALMGLAARRDARTLAIHTRGAVVTWDLADVLPDPIATGVFHSWMVDDLTLVISELVNYVMIYEWVDLATRTRTPIAMPPGLATWHASDPATDRELIVLENAGVPDATFLAHRGRSEVTRLELPGLRKIAFAGPELVAGTAAGELVLLGERPPPRVVHRFDSAVDFLVGNATWIAAMAKSGALARFDRATGALDTATPPFEVAWFVLTRTGDVYLAAERDVYRWRGRGFERIATLPAAIATVDDSEAGTIIAFTRQRAVYAIDPDRAEPDRITRLLFRSEHAPRFDRSTRFMALDPSGGEATIFDLAHGTRWRLPYGESLDSLSPSGRLALLFTHGRVSIAHIDAPDEPAELRAWVRRATNHTLDAPGP